jgi:hypothetical protein
MRMSKLFGVGLLLAVLAVVAGVGGFGTEAATDVYVNFTIPSYIAISTENDGVSLGDISGPNTYSNEDTLYVVSTKGWSVEHSFEWSEHPDGFNPDGSGADLFSVSGEGDGQWGYDSFDATYSLDLSGENMQHFPEGDYIVTVTHTATTSE